MASVTPAIVSIIFVVAGAGLDVFARQLANRSQPPAMPLPPDDRAPDLQLPERTPEIQRERE